MKINQLLQTLKFDNKYDIKPKEKTASETILSSFKSKNEAVNLLADKYQVGLDEKDARTLDDFMAKSEGTTESKLQTVELALFKGIELTPDNLDSIHTALNQTPNLEAEILLNPEMEADLPSMETIIDHLKLPVELKEALKAYIAEGKSVEEAVTLVAKAILSKLDGVLPADVVAALNKVADNGSMAELVKSMNQVVLELPNTMEIIGTLLAENELPLTFSETGTDMQSKAPASLKVLIDSLVEAITTEADEASKITKEPMTISDQGDLISKDRLTLVDRLPAKEGFTERTSDQISDEKTDADTDGAKRSKSLAANLEIPEEQVNTELDSEQLLETLQALLGALTDVTSAIESTFDVKTFIVETVTEKSYALQKAFESMKAEIVTLTNPEAKPTAEDIQKAINALEKMMMKSEVTLYTDMHTEKKLLVMTSDLNQAKALLSSGDTKSAFEILKQTHESLKKIQVNMNPQKLQSFATKRIEETFELLRPESDDDDRRQETLKMRIETLLDTQKDASGARSGRDVLEVLRGLGLNHEMEIAEEIATKNQQVKTEWINANVKEILMKLMKEETTDRNIEETLMSLTGQQMMNDSNPQRQQKFQFFNLPFEDDTEINNMKVYMTGKNHAEMLDVNNASLYFGMDLKHFGDTGIKINVSGGIVEMTVMNDYVAEFEEAFAGIDSELEQIGFGGVKVKFAAYRKVQAFALQGEMKPAETFRYDEQKGFDFKI